MEWLVGPCPGGGRAVFLCGKPMVRACASCDCCVPPAAARPPRLTLLPLLFCTTP